MAHRMLAGSCKAVNCRCSNNALTSVRRVSGQQGTNGVVAPWSLGCWAAGTDTPGSPRIQGCNRRPRVSDARLLQIVDQHGQRRAMADVRARFRTIVGTSAIQPLQLSTLDS